MAYYIDDATSFEFELRSADGGWDGGELLLCIDTGEFFEKDLSGKWWVNMFYGGERGPFNSLEHACLCTKEFFDENDLWKTVGTIAPTKPLVK